MVFHSDLLVFYLTVLTKGQLQIAAPLLKKMIVEGIHIRNILKMDDTLMLKQDQLNKAIRDAIELGRSIGQAEQIESNTIMKGNELAKYLKKGMSTLRRWRKYGHPKYGKLPFMDGLHIRMSLKDAKELRDKFIYS